MNARHVRRSSIAVMVAIGFPALATGDQCMPWVEEHPRWNSVSLRVHADAFMDCSLDEAGYNRILTAWLAARDAQASAPDSIALGRLVRHPWIARYLARTALDHPAWNAARGRPHEGHANDAVVAILMTSDFMARLRRPLAEHGLQVTGLSVEKVLVDTARNVLGSEWAADRRVPFDAQLWLVLKAQ